MTSFNLDNPSHVDVAFTEGGTAVLGNISPLGFVLSHGPNGAFVLSRSGPNGSLRAVQQMGNMGGGLLASIQNSLNNQLIQQQVTMNIGIQNMSTIMGLRTLGVMVDRMGTSLVR
jgi:hypothetical protein